MRSAEEIRRRLEERRSPRKAAAADRDAKAVALVDDGMSTADVAIRLRCSDQTVRAALRRAGRAVPRRWEGG